MRFNQLSKWLTDDEMSSFLQTFVNEGRFNPKKDFTIKFKGNLSAVFIKPEIKLRRENEKKMMYDLSELLLMGKSAKQEGIPLLKSVSRYL